MDYTSPSGFEEIYKGFTLSNFLSCNNCTSADWAIKPKKIEKEIKIK